MRIQKSDLFEDTVHHFSVFASDIQLSVNPCMWDKRIDVFPEMGNRLGFMQISVCDSHAVYKQVSGCVYIQIWND